MNTPSPAEVPSLPKPLRIFLYVQAISAVLCLFTELVCGVFLKLRNPYNWPLTPLKERTADLNEYADRFAYFHQVYFFYFRPSAPFAYPAPMALLYRVIYILPKHRTPLFLFVLFVLIAIGAFLVARAFMREGLARRSAYLFCGLSAALSYPFFFEAKQGNLEIVLWVLIAGGIWLLLRGRGYSAAACFGVAGSLKIFPLIYLGLHLAQRRWKPFLFGLALVPPITLASLWLLLPNVASTWHHLQANVAYAQERIVLRVVHREIGFDHSLFSVLKRSWLIAGFTTPLSTVLRIYMLVVAVTGIVLYFGRIRKLPFANQVLCLAVCSILLPPVSYDYTLVHLYAPFVLLALNALNRARKGVPLSGATSLFLMLGFAIAPLSEIIAHGVRFGGQVRAVVLLLLLVAALVIPFGSTAEEAARTA